MRNSVDQMAKKDKYLEYEQQNVQSTQGVTFRDSDEQKALQPVTEVNVYKKPVDLEKQK